MIGGLNRSTQRYRRRADCDGVPQAAELQELEAERPEALKQVEATYDKVYDKAHERFIPYLGCAPSSKRPWGEFDRARLEEAIARYRKPA